MERSLLLAKKYQNLKVDDEQRLHIEFDNQTNSVPKTSSKSEVIDNLISQNEDLSARMKVLLRRLASIEEENIKLTQEHRDMKHQLSALNDQIEVFNEKETDLKNRAFAAEETLDIQQSQIRQKEIEFAKLRSVEWEQRENLKSQLEILEKKFKTLYRYRARIKEKIKPRYKNLNKTILEKDIRIEQYRIEIQNTEIQCQALIQKNLEQVKKSRETVKNIEESKLQLIGQFEQTHKDFMNELKSLNEINQELRKKSALLDKSLERQDYLENKAIFMERENQDLRNQYNNEYSLLQNQMLEWRNKAQTLEVENISLQERLLELENQYKRTEEIADRLDEQMESLRLLWKEKVHENERLKRNQEALEEINKELSIKLNDYRADEFIESNIN